MKTKPKIAQIALIVMVAFAACTGPISAQDSGSGGGSSGGNGGGGTGPAVQPPDSLPMIISRAALRSYALERARSAYVGLYSQSLVPSNGVANYRYAKWDTPQTEPGLVGIISTMRPAFCVANVNDPISLSSSIADENGYTLFMASKLFWLTNGLPPDAGVVRYRLTEYLPIKVQGVRRAEMKFLSDDGTTWWRSEELYANDGYVFFPGRLAGARAQLYLTFSDGNAVAYKAETGFAITPFVGEIQLSGHPNGLIEHLRSFKGSGAISEEVKSGGGVGYNPTFEYISTAANQVVEIKVASSEGKYPLGYYIRQQGGTGWAYYTSSLGRLIGSFDEGVFYIIPNWDPADFREPDFFDVEPLPEPTPTPTETTSQPLQNQ